MSLEGYYQINSNAGGLLSLGNKAFMSALFWFGWPVSEQSGIVSKAKNVSQLLEEKHLHTYQPENKNSRTDIFFFRILIRGGVNNRNPNRNNFLM